MKGHWRNTSHFFGSFSRYGGWPHCPSRWQSSQPLWGPSDFGRHWAERYENGRGIREPTSSNTASWIHSNQDVDIKMIHWPATSGWDRQVESGRSSPPHIPHSTTYPFVPRIPSSHASTPAQRTLRPSNTWPTEVWKPLMCKAVNDIHLEQWKKRGLQRVFVGLGVSEN